MGFWSNRRVSRIARLIGLGAISLVLTNCVTDNVASRADRKHNVGASSRTVVANEIPSKSASVTRKHPMDSGREPARKAETNYSAVGVASWYGDQFHGRRTANGETFDMNSLSAAHPSLPLPSNVRVTNLINQRSVVVRVNDRGPYVGGRVIDVSAKTAKLLGFYGNGLSKVKVEYVGRAQ